MKLFHNTVLHNTFSNFSSKNPTLKNAKSTETSAGPKLENKSSTNHNHKFTSPSTGNNIQESQVSNIIADNKSSTFDATSNSGGAASKQIYTLDSMSTPTPLNNALRTPNTSHSLMLQGSKKTNSFPKNEADSAESMEKNLSPKNASLIHQKRKSPFELEPSISTSRVNKQSSIPLSGLEAVMNLHKLNSTVAKPNTSKTLLDNKSSTQKDSDPYDITAATDIDPALHSVEKRKKSGQKLKKNFAWVFQVKNTKNVILRFEGFDLKNPKYIFF